jgi:hypothetical protein
VNAERPELLAELLETCRRTLRELDDVADEPDVWALRADIVEVVHQTETALETSIRLRR